MGKNGFKDLKVWQMAKDLAVEIYKITNTSQFRKDFGLRDQVQRSVSIASNLAEGDERKSDKDSLRFFYIAKGSLAELRTQLQIAHEIGHIDKQQYLNIETKCIELGKMIGKLIKYRENSK